METQKKIANFIDSPSNNGLNDEEIHELEGIVGNEPPQNKYQVIKFHKLNLFPYFLIGKVVSKFDFDGVNKYLNGVGILIGPDILLTVAHNLCHIQSDGKILYSKKVAFYPAANGDFNIFDPIKSTNYYIPNEYIEALKSRDRDQQLFNDWGYVKLPVAIGDSIAKILDVEKLSYIKNINGFYNYFVNNENQNLSKLSELSHNKISIIGYTQYQQSYKDNPAYKFRSNFVFNEINNEINNQIVQQLSSPIKNNDAKQDKNINISININTNNNDYTENIIQSSKLLNGFTKKMNENPNSIIMNGSDYIILGNEQFNKEFDHDDVDKLIMCESKGTILGDANDFNGDFEEFYKSIRYQISTYKGQSGSPIFLRMKKFSEKGQKSSYFYHFIGLHSRRGPQNDKNFYESEKMNSVTENLVTSNAYSYMEQGSNKNLIDLNENEIVKQHGTCQYNLALSILGNTLKLIKDRITQENHRISLDGKEMILKSDYIMTKLVSNGQVHVSGLFRRNIPLSVLFNFGAKILNVPNTYVLLKDLSNHEFSTIQNFKFDANKKLSEILEDEHTHSISIEVSLMAEKYAEFLGKRILEKFLDSHGLEEEDLKEDLRSNYQKLLFQSIFTEINNFDVNTDIYGKLFKKIRSYILKQLNLNN